MENWLTTENSNMPDAFEKLFNETPDNEFDDAEEELRRMEEFRKAQAEIDKQNPPKPASQVLFKVI